MSRPAVGAEARIFRTAVRTQPDGTLGRGLKRRKVRASTVFAEITVRLVAVPPALDVGWLAKAVVSAVAVRVELPGEVQKSVADVTLLPPSVVPAVNAALLVDSDRATVRNTAAPAAPSRSSSGTTAGRRVRGALMSGPRLPGQPEGRRQALGRRVVPHGHHEAEGSGLTGGGGVPRHQAGVVAAVRGLEVGEGAGEQRGRRGEPQAVAEGPGVRRPHLDRDVQVRRQLPRHARGV